MAPPLRAQPGLMPLIKRNSREFLDVKKLIEEYADKPSRKKLILLYSLKPAQKLKDRILINSLAENSDTLYEMHYGSLLDYFSDKAQKLYREDKEALYYFKNSPASTWLQLPFEFKGKLKTRLFPLRKLD
jgi:hypothetical protein